MLYFISDVHGEYELFEKLLRKINFQPTDEMIVCGDMIDKGPQPIRLTKRILHTPNIRAILGNHDYFFLKYYWSLMEKSPEDFDWVLKKLQAYFPNDGALLDWDTVDRLEALPLYIEGEDYICVHAAVPRNEEGEITSLCEASVEQLVYDRSFKEPHALPKNSKCILFGHTPVNYVSGKNEILLYPRKEGASRLADYYKIHLDMDSSRSGVMGCICRETLQTFYVNKKD